MDIRVDFGATEKEIAKLIKINKSALPSAIRNTLNNSAFNMKKSELPKSFKKTFKPKKNTLPFYRKLNQVKKANGFNIARMQSAVGLLNPSSKKDVAFVRGLEKQEEGGIADDGLRYLKHARGGRLRNRVLTENIYDKSKVISGRSRRKGSIKSKFVARVFRAQKENKPLFFNTRKGNFLVRVKKLSSSIGTKKLDIDFEFIASQRKMQQSKIKKTNFTEKAGIEQRKLISKEFVRNAEFQIKKYLK